MPTSRRRWRSSKPTDRWRGRRGSRCLRRCCSPKACSRRRKTPRRAPARRWRWEDPQRRGPRGAREGGAGQGGPGAERREPRPAGGRRMTAPDGGAQRASMVETVQTTDGFLRHAGREFLVVLYTAFRYLKLYPLENDQVQKALDDLWATTKHLLEVEKELEVRLQGEFIFVNSTRLRLDLDNYASFSHILSVLHQCGIGAVR